MAIESHDETNGGVFEVRGSFDPDEADRLHALLHAAKHQRVTIDFRGVRILHDSAVARLAPELEDRGRHVALLGLNEHHRRLLRYCASSPQPAGHA
jgi:anti-anti-sigma regulatory factor